MQIFYDFVFWKTQPNIGPWAYKFGRLFQMKKWYVHVPRMALLLVMFRWKLPGIIVHSTPEKKWKLLYVAEERNKKGNGLDVPCKYVLKGPDAYLKKAESIVKDIN